jgi:hypothetical protein
MAPKRLLAALGAVPVVLVGAAVAVGAPARTATLDATKTVFEWEDGPRHGATGSDAANPAPMCSEPGFPCDDTLLKIDAAGDFEVAVDAEGLVRPDIDLYMYASNPAGEAGKQVKASETPNPDEKITFKAIKPGFYLVRAAYFSGFNVTYKGKATLKPAATASAPAAPGAAAPANSAPQARIAAVAATVKRSRLKAFKGTASDDGKVARVEVGVLQRKGSKCRQMTARGTFAPIAKCTEPTTFVAAKGTTSWRLKLRKRFAKGSYSVFARAIDDAGSAQQGFGPESKREFKVK